MERILAMLLENTILSAVVRLLLAAVLVDELDKTVEDGEFLLQR